jgi:NitT/TauT family transport system permease protein
MAPSNAAREFSTKMKNDLEENTARHFAPTEIAENDSADSRQGNLIANWRELMVLLPGLCTLVVWELAAWRWPGVAKLVSQPTEIARGIVDVIVTGTIWQHLDATLREMAAGYIIGAIAGVALGLLCGRIRILGDIFNPYITLFNGIPKVALAPVFVIWFGIGLMSKIAIILTMVFFVVFINTFAGLRSVNEDYVAIVRIMGATGWQVVRDVFLPATLPFIIVGLRAGIPFSVIGAVVGEFIASTKGLGFYINYNQGTYDTNGIFVGVTILAVLVVVLDWLLSLVERRLLKWRPEVEAKSVGA